MVARAFEHDSLFSLIAGPLVWSAHFLLIYVFTALACARGFFHDEILGIRIVPLVGSALSLVAVALIIDALYLSWRRWQGGLADDERLPGTQDDDGTTSRRQFMARAGLLLSAVALVATVWQTLPVFFFASCR
jgi:hypothetical protein